LCATGDVAAVVGRDSVAVDKGPGATAEAVKVEGEGATVGLQRKAVACGEDVLWGIGDGAVVHLTIAVEAGVGGGDAGDVDLVVGYVVHAQQVAGCLPVDQIGAVVERVVVFALRVPAQVEVTRRCDVLELHGECGDGWKLVAGVVDIEAGVVRTGEVDRVDGDWGVGPVVGGGEVGAVLEAVDEGAAVGVAGIVDDFTKDGVEVVEPGGGGQGDEELRAVGVGTGVGHGDRVVGVGQAGVEFILKDVARAAAAGAEWVASLNHEVVNQTVKDQAVVVGLVDLELAGAGVDPVALARSQADEIRHGAGCFVVVELDPEGAEGASACGNGNVGVDLCVKIGG